MKVYELLRDVLWEDIEAEMAKDLNKFPPRSYPGYKHVYDTLRTIKPEPDEYGVIKHYDNTDTVTEEKYESVVVTHPNKKPDPDDLLINGNGEVEYCFSFTPWKYILDWYVNIPNSISKAHMLLLIIYEITWYGFTEEKIRKAEEKLLAIIRTEEEILN